MVDLLVVGSGPVGCTFARLVADTVPDARILMVDAGPRLTDPPGMNLKNLPDAELRRTAQVASEGPAPAGEEAMAEAAVGGRAEVQTLARGTARLARPGTHLVDGELGGLPAAAMSSNVGGMGAHWTCAAPRPGDSERIDFLDLDAAFAVAERLLHVRTDVFPPSPLSDRIHGALRAVFDPVTGRPVQPMPLACRLTDDGRRVWSGADTVLGALAERESFELRSETLCRRLVVEGDVVTGAELEHLPTGATEVVGAAVVVVAADPLRTPQLLWASGVRPRALGAYLNDQPQILSAVRLSDRIAGGDNGAGDPSLRASVIASGVFWVPFADERHPVHGQIMHFDLSAAPPDDPRDAASGHVLALSWYCAKELREEDRIEFRDGEADAFGMPRMVLHHGLTDADRAAIARAIEHQSRAAEALGDYLAGQEPHLLPPGSSLHYQGTVRMGRRHDGRSVCDTDSRVWGVRNLFVGGNGVIPTATACNPTLTSVALAAHASRAVAGALAR